MNKYEQFWERPGRFVYILLPVFHFISVKLTFLCAVIPPENGVVIWLPNAVLLAALLRFRGRRGWALAALAFSSDVIAKLPVFSWSQAVLMSIVNLIEVGATYLLMRRIGASPDLKRMRDLRKFVIAGPVVGALIAGLLGAAVIQAMTPTATSYFTLTRVWWFADGLGLLIYTPLLLAFTQPQAEPFRVRRTDGMLMLLTAALAGVIFSAHSGEIHGVSVTPTLLLPLVLFIAFRFGIRWTTLTVALISLVTSMMLVFGRRPFGEAPVYLETVRAQEFILTLCIVGMGFAVLLNELIVRERELEARVRQRTRELETSNSKLAALSATDGLTGIANRRHFDQVLDSEWSHAMRSGLPIALMMLDVDLFKQYNDRYGHQAGDDCLRAVARILSLNVRRTDDFVARYGGEEFAVIVPMTDHANALDLAETICRSLEALALPHAVSPFNVVTISIGVAVRVPGKNESMQALVHMADLALYQAKQLGRNRVVTVNAAQKGRDNALVRSARRP
ncbi:MAG: PleD [Herbaspirillum sp.]|nr:PleD [Herbaspirillum sp.]